MELPGRVIPEQWPSPRGRTSLHSDVQELRAEELTGDKVGGLLRPSFRMS